MDRALGTMRIAAKAGKLILGEEAVSAAASQKRVRVILTANDAGQSTLRRAERAAEQASVEMITLPCGKEEFGFGLGRGKLAMAAFTDAGLAAGFMEKLRSEYPDDASYAMCAQALAEKAASLESRRGKGGRSKKNRTGE